jgi:hypothetical protein
VKCSLGESFDIALLRHLLIAIPYSHSTMDKLDVVMKKLFPDFSIDENFIHNLDISTVKT